MQCRGERRVQLFLSRTKQKEHQQNPELLTRGPINEFSSRERVESPNIHETVHRQTNVKKSLFVQYGNAIVITQLADGVESNGCLAVKPKIPKMLYAEAARVSDVVKAQDRLITNGGDPTTSLDRLATTGPNRPKANDEKPITGLVNLDIKKK